MSPAGALLDPAPLRIGWPADGYAEVAYAALASDGAATLAAWLESSGTKSIDAALVFPPASR